MPSKFTFLILVLFLSAFCYGQIPILDSDPSNTTKVVYLDFDGQTVSGTNWNSGNTVNALASTMNSANIIEIYKRVCEDYCPFDVSITTNVQKFNNAQPTSRMRVIITPTSAWYGNAGGVAYVGSFTWGGTPGTPCWVFENMLSYSAKNIAEAISHEVGHTLTLRHQSTYIYPVPTCSKTAEYNPGQGTGVTSWAPIMGVGYSKNVTTWYNGKSSLNCNLTQNDLSNSITGITTPGYLNFLADDVGNTSGTAKNLNLNTLNLADSGRISEPTDIDVYQFTICNNRYVSIGVKPWALDTIGYQGANLDVRLFLYNSANNQLAVDTPLTKLNALIGMNLSPGTYWFTIDGGGSANYSDYGSLGRYYLTIKATNPPAIYNAVVTSNTLCAGQTASLNYVSNGTPTQWLWTINGPTSATYTTQNPMVTFNAGTYSITLLANTANLGSCPTTASLSVNPLPAVAIITPTNTICSGKSLTLSAAGASSYTWFPGSFTGSSQVISPAATANYTLQGFDGLCGNETVTTISVSPHFSISVSATDSSICFDDFSILSGAGASSYTFNPGNYPVATLVVFNQSVTTTYTITGSNPNNACLEETTITIATQDCEALGITQSEGNNAGVRIYPNPSHDYVMIETSSNGHSIEIFNSLGQLIITQLMNGKPLRIITELWPRDVYFVTLSSEKTPHYSQKIILR